MQIVQRDPLPSATECLSWRYLDHRAMTLEPSVDHRLSSRQRIERARRLADGLIQTRYCLFNIRVVEPVPFNWRKGWQEWWGCAADILGQVAASRLASSPTRLRLAWRSH